MIDTQKLKTTVVRALNIAPENYREDLGLGEIPEWDSLGQLNLIFSIEDAFEVKFDSEVIPKLRNLTMVKAELERCLKS